MTGTQAKPLTPTHSWRTLILRTVGIVVAAALIGFAMRHISAALDRNPRPAGFGRGVLQGALMPCALPALAVGSDVVIYAQRNTGIPYKLGYTCGVNACGAVFFGLFFWRVSRWRKRRAL